MKRSSEHSFQSPLAADAASPVRRVSGLWTALAIAVALVGAVFAAAPLLTRFASYDDEGYMLVSLARYLKYGHLYAQTFSQYGPFHFYAQSVFFQLLHLPVTHDMGRLVTLFYWAASSLLAAICVYRFSKSTFLACAAGLCAMLAGNILTNEPGHPQQIVLLLYMIACWLSRPSPSGRNYLRFCLLGCVGAALAFTKVNVGVFYVAGLAHALVCLLPSGKIRSLGLVLTLAYATAFPWLLMHASFSQGFRNYCIVATVCGIATFACGAMVQARDRLSMRAALCCGAGLLGGTVAIVAATSLQGMTASTLVWGVILNPLQQHNLFHTPLPIGLGALPAAVILTAAVVGLRSLERLAESWWLDAVRCVVGIGSIFLLTLQHEIRFVAPLLPLTLIARSHLERDAGALFSRLFITYMAATQFLEPYPVAGSQVGIAGAPMILWAFLCTTDGIDGLRTSWRRWSQDFGTRFRMDAAIGWTILVTVAALCMTRFAHNRLPPAATGLKGAAWLHLPARRTAQFEAIAGSARTNCSILFTMPGMGSFNMWSGVPTPNGWNMTGWMRGIGSERQAEILSILEANPQSCAILDRRMLPLWDIDQTGLDALPLARYIMTDMTKMAEFGEYEIRVHPHRISPWLRSQ